MKKYFFEKTKTLLFTNILMVKIIKSHQIKYLILYRTEIILVLETFTKHFPFEKSILLQIGLGNTIIIRICIRRITNGKEEKKRIGKYPTPHPSLLGDSWALMYVCELAQRKIDQKHNYSGVIIILWALGITGHFLIILKG